MVDRIAQSLVERRTVLRAGVWTAPAVVVVAAVPAYAACSSGGLTGTMVASYVNHTNPSTVDPTRIQVTSTVKNNGATATTGYARILRIPAGLFDSVTAPSVSGYSGPTRTGTEATGLTLTYVRLSQLGAGASETFAPTLTVGDTSASPFRGWRGSSFTLDALVNGGGTCGTLPTPASVAATPDTTLAISGWRAQRSSTSLWIGDENASGTASTYVRNTGRKAVGPVTLTVTVPDAAGAWSAVAAQAPDNITAGWQFVSRTPADNANGPWVYTLRTTDTVLAPGALNGNSQNDRTPRFRARILLAGALGGEPRTVNVTAVASAPGATNSPVASNDAD